MWSPFNTSQVSPGGVPLSALVMLGLAMWADWHVESMQDLEPMEAEMPWIQRGLLPSRERQRALSGESTGQEAM